MVCFRLFSTHCYLADNCDTSVYELQPVFFAGLGCERNCEAQELSDLLATCLASAGLSVCDLGSISSVDIKADEAGLIKLAADLALPFQTWPATSLRHYDHLLTTRSDIVYKTVGVYGVAESAALQAAGEIAVTEPELVVTKQKSRRATCAIARAYR